MCLESLSPKSSFTACMKLGQVHRLDVPRQQPDDVTESCADKGKEDNQNRMAVEFEMEASVWAFTVNSTACPNPTKGSGSCCIFHTGAQGHLQAEQVW